MLFVSCPEPLLLHKTRRLFCWSPVNSLARFSLYSFIWYWLINIIVNTKVWMAVWKHVYIDSFPLPWQKPKTSLYLLEQLVFFSFYKCHLLSESETTFLFSLCVFCALVWNRTEYICVEHSYWCESALTLPTMINSSV